MVTSGKMARTAVGGEHLEPTLRVFDAGQRQPLHDAVEQAAHHMTVGGSPTRGALPFARADRDVEVAQRRRQEARELGDRHRQVGVADEAEAAVGRQQSCFDRAAFAAVWLAL